MKLVMACFLTIAAFLIEPIVTAELSNADLRLRGLGPNVILVPLLVATIRLSGPLAVVSGGLIGLVCDCIAGTVLGVQMGIFAILSATGRFWLPERTLSTVEVFRFCFVFTLALELVSTAARALLDGRTATWGAVLAVAAGTSVSTALCVAGLWLGGRRLAGLVGGAARAPSGRVPRIGAGCSD